MSGRPPGKGGPLRQRLPPHVIGTSVFLLSRLPSAPLAASPGSLAMARPIAEGYMTVP